MSKKYHLLGAGSENLLIKLKHNFFGLDRELIVCFSYCIPENSSYQVREQLDVLRPGVKIKLCRTTC